MRPVMWSTWCANNTMLAIWTFFTEKPALTYLVTLSLVLFGVGSALTIQRESAPEVQVPVAIVTSTLSGASPEDVESLLVEELESAVANIDGIKKLTSTAREGVGTVVVEFDASADIQESIDKVKDEVDKVRGDLPEDATEPVVSEVNFADQPVVIAALTSDLPVTEFRKEAELLKERIEGVRGVSRAEVSGVREPEVRVVVRKEALTLHGLTLEAVVNALRANNVTFPVGSIEMGGVEYAVEFKGKLTDPSEVADVPIVTPNGTVLTLADIATVAPGVEDYSTIARVSQNGSPATQAATLTVYKQRGSDITALSRDVTALLKRENGNGTTLTTAITFDAGDQILRDLRQLSGTGLQTVGLVLLVLLVALGWREALIASLSIPLSFLTALMVMNATSNTINFISLFSLILSVGLLVDTAIVVVEAIHTNLKKDGDKHAAVIQALAEYHYPLTSGNLTTIAVFAPLFTISGVTGEFIDSIPFTVIAVLVSSLAVSLGIIPLIATSLLRRRSVSTLEQRQEAYAEKVRAWYRRTIPLLLDYRGRKRALLSGLTVLLIALMSAPAVGLIKVSFFPQGNVDFLYISIEEPQGTPLARTDLSARAVEEVLLTIPEIESFTTTVGAGSVFDESPESGPRYASVSVNLDKDRERTSSLILTDIEQALAGLPGIDARVQQPNEGPPTGAPVLITFFGDDMVELKGLAARAADTLREIEGTRTVEASGQDDATEFALRVDRRRAAELGLSPAQLAGTLRTAIFGTDATTIKRGGDEIDVVVTLNLNSAWRTVYDTNRVSLEALRDLPVQTPQGTVLLGSVLSESLEASSDTIRREDEERIATVTANVREGANARDVSAEFEHRFLEEGPLPDGVRMKVGGETEDVDQSFRDTFRALGIGIVLILAVLVVQFNSYRQALIVLSTVPLSLIGVLLGLLLTREYLSFPSMLGFIALAGVVVNNAIILVDVWNRMRVDHPELPLRTVVIEGAALRLRPIFLTTLTTIVGIAPLAFASDLWRPIAIAIIFGLSFAVVLTLVLVPALYLKWTKR